MVEDVIEPALDELGLEQGSTGCAQHRGHRHVRRPGPARQLHREVEGRGRRRVLHLRPVRRGEASSSSTRSRTRSRRRCSLDRRHRRHVAGGAGRGERGSEPNPYEGIISVDGRARRSAGHRNAPMLKHCREVYEKATGDEDRRRPTSSKPGPDGKRVEIYVAVVGLLRRALHVQGDRREGRAPTSPTRRGPTR